MASSITDFEFEVGSPHLQMDCSVITYPVYRGALEVFAVGLALPVGAGRHSSSTIAPVDRPAARSARALFEVAWIGYLSAPLAAGLTPPPDLVAERTPGGGLILSAVQTRIDPSNPDHMRRSRQLEAIMLERVGLSEYGRPNAPPARVGLY